ncbi:AIPR family protein [Umezawaea sp.]|uniref:AIPR family protein n=1 Tax=Umezawaea sp. TaxID=1955258 RepID=UPI002ED2EBB5
MDLVIQGLVKEFQDVQSLTELPRSEAFEAFAAYCVLSSYYEGEFSPDDHRTGGGNDLGIDAFGVVVNGELCHDVEEVRAAVDAVSKPDVQIVVVQAKTTSGFETKVVSDLADNLCHVLGSDPLAYQASEDVRNLRDCVKAVYGDIGKLSSRLPQLHVHYVTTGDTVADLVAQKAHSAEKQLAEPGLFETVEFHCVVRGELRKLYRRATTKVAATFPMPKKVFFPKVPHVDQSLLGLLAAKDLVHHVLCDEAGRLRKTLFNDNVRDFQGYNDVNSEIRDTLRDPVRRERFAVLNNGITIVTRGLTVVGDDVHVDDFQIVNGCQTCHVLFEHRDQLTDAVHVSVRIVHSQDEDLINGIVAATNRQTVVTEEDLTVREEFHRLLEDHFHRGRDKQRSLYYERRSKQYSESKHVEKTRVITRAQLTRAYVAMFLEEPSRSGHLKTLLAARGKELFSPDQQPIVYYAAAATFYRVEWLIRNRRIPTGYSPARYHLLAAIKLRLLGSDRVPPSSKAAVKQCERILDLVWDANESERLVLELLDSLQRAIDAETGLGVRLGEMVRTQRFAERVRREVLGPAR